MKLKRIFLCIVSYIFQISYSHYISFIMIKELCFLTTYFPKTATTGPLHNKSPITTTLLYKQIVSILVVNKGTPRFFKKEEAVLLKKLEIPEFPLMTPWTAQGPSRSWGHIPDQQAALSP